MQVAHSHAGDSLHGNRSLFSLMSECACTHTNKSEYSAITLKKEPKPPKLVSHTFGGWEILGQGAGRFGSC